MKATFLVSFFRKIFIMIHEACKQILANDKHGLAQFVTCCNNFADVIINFFAVTSFKVIAGNTKVTGDRVEPSHCPPTELVPSYFISKIAGFHVAH